MAEDRLMFPIGFDLDSATKEATKEWDSKYAAQLEKAIQKRPIKVKLAYDIKQLNNLDAVQKRLKDLKIAPVTPQTKSAISSLISELKKLETILTKIDSLNAKTAISTGKATRDNIKTLKAQEDLQNRIKVLQERLQQAQIRTAIAQERYRKAVEGTGRAYKSTEGYISRLIQRTLVLFGIRQVVRFAERLREVTAEFELQRVSLGAIIQDTEKANALFSQIKTFAVQSPFEIKDLVGYVKQLSAYRIETDKLFDTTKRLADVSAGLGTDMSRLILAYGQVRAASVLRGQEVRQFTEAGIPLIELLAEKFTALRGEMVSTSEVFDLISQRAVSFQMVAEIFEDMTNAGGIFYNMQEKQAQTLAGQWSNLKDSLSIMYDEMGNTKDVQAGMRGIISLTKTLAENWQLVEAYMFNVVGGFAIVKGIGAYKSLVNVVKKDVLGAYTQLRVAQREYNAAIIAEKNLLTTATQAERAAAATKVKTTAATLAAAKATAQAARGTTVLTYAWRKLTAVMKANWVGLLISALVVAYQTISHLVSKSNELRDALADVGKAGRADIAKMTTNFQYLAEKAVKAADGSREQNEALSELQRTYKDMIPVHKLTIENLKELKGNYNALTGAITEYINQRTLATEIDTIIENTAKKIADSRKELKDYLTDEYTLGLDELSAQRLLNAIEDVVKKTDLTDMGEIIRLAIKRSGMEDQIGAEWVQALSLYRSSMLSTESDMLTFANAIRLQGNEIKRVTGQYKDATGDVGKYASALKQAQKEVSDWAAGHATLTGYEFEKGKVQQAAKSYFDVIRQIFKDNNLAFNEKWLDGEFIDMISIEKAIKAAGMNITSQAENAFKQVRKAYYDIVPSDKFARSINDEFKRIASDMKINMNQVKKYLKQDDESIEDYVKNFYTNIEQLEDKIRNAKNLKLETLDEGQIEKNKKDLAIYQQELALLKEIEPYIRGFKRDDKSGLGGDNAEIQRLKLMVSLLEKVYAKYKEYTKYVSQSDAQERINREFGKTLEIFNQYGIELPKTSEEYQKALKKLQDIMRTLPKSQKDVLELGFKIENVDWEDTKRDLETELKRLADEVSRTKVAKEFFDKMLNLTGDRELSATVTMSVYGGTGDELKQRIIDQIRNAFQTTTGDELDLSLAINYNTLEVDYLKLAQLAEQNKDILLEASKDTRDGIIKAGLETTAARIAQWEKDIQKDQTYSEKRIRLAQETAQKIADIDVSNIPDAEKKRLQEGYRQREQEQAADLAWNAFKDSPMYVQMFDKLETASTTMLNAMLDKLKQLKAQWGESLSPTELKELQSRMNEIESQLANKNPFKTLADAIKEYRTLTKEKSYKESVQELAKNMQQADIEAGKYAEALRLAQEAEQRYIEIKKEKGDNSDEAKNAKKAADEAWNQARAQQSVADKAQEVANKSQKTVDAYKQCADKAKAAGSALGEWTDKLNVAFDGIRNIMDAFGASDEDMQFFDDIVGGFNNVSQGAQQGAMAVASFMSGDILGGVTNAIGSIGNIISGFTDIFYAGRIRRANKEIKRQQEIIDALEYSYSRLQKTVDKLFGSEYIANFRKQQDNLRAEIVATEKQLEAEKSKGKKKDKDKIKDYKDSIRDLKDQLEDLIGTLSQQMLGTDLASAARSFAQSWLDAYKEFGDTRKAIEDEMQKMMENLIVESVLGAVMQKALEPVFKMIDEMGTSDFYDDNFWTKIVDEMNKSTDNALTGASVITAKLEKAGINIRDLGSDFTGISKDIASASEESILGLSSNILTQNYYISHIDTTVSQILAMMSGGGTDFSSNEQIADLITIQNQHLAYLPNIALNTAQTAERCERAAAACENIAENLNRVIKPNGVQGSYRVNTSL